MPRSNRLALVARNPDHIDNLTEEEVHQLRGRLEMLRSRLEARLYRTQRPARATTSQPSTEDTRRAQDLEQPNGLDDDVPELLTTAEAADWLGVTADTVAKWCREGRIPDASKTSPDGGEWRIPASSLTEAQTSMRVSSDQEHETDKKEHKRVKLNSEYK